MTQQPRDAIRPAPERPAGGDPAAATPAAAAPGALAPGSPKPNALPAWHWRLVIFLWITSMLFLGLYEFLCAFLRVVFFPASP